MNLITADGRSRTEVEVAADVMLHASYSDMRFAREALRADSKSVTSSLAGAVRMG
jgi:hypothetical protein